MYRAFKFRLYLNDEQKHINERTYECECCHNEIDRDLNASININFEGVKRYMKEVLAS